MAAVLLFLLATTLAVGANPVPESKPYASSCSQTQLVDGIVARCKGANAALFAARDECCNELGKHTECGCQVLTEVFGQLSQLPRLCENYNACSGRKAETYYGGSRAILRPGCQLLDPKVRACTVSTCEKVFKELTMPHHECLHDLVALKRESGVCFDDVLRKLGIKDYGDVIEKLCEQNHY
ncbi:hypothetical protein ACP70R_011890 [Stipagrostis hirtigluma subsp. patula]